MEEQLKEEYRKVLVYDEFRQGHTKYRLLTVDYSPGCINLEKYAIEVPGLELFVKGKEAYAIRTKSHVARIECDLVSVSALAYLRLKTDQEERGLHEDCVLIQDHGQCMIFLGEAEIDWTFNIIPTGNWTDHKPRSAILREMSELSGLKMVPDPKRPRHPVETWHERNVEDAEEEIKPKLGSEDDEDYNSQFSPHDLSGL